MYLTVYVLRKPVIKLVHMLTSTVQTLFVSYLASYRTDATHFYISKQNLHLRRDDGVRPQYSEVRTMRHKNSRRVSV